MIGFGQKNAYCLPGLNDIKKHLIGSTLTLRYMTLEEKLQTNFTQFSDGVHYKHKLLSTDYAVSSKVSESPWWIEETIHYGRKGYTLFLLLTPSFKNNNFNFWEGNWKVAKSTSNSLIKINLSSTYFINSEGSSGFKVVDFDYESPNGLSNCVKQYVRDKINDWEQKEEFETTVAFQERLNENSRKNMLEKYRNEAIEHFKKDAINSISHKDISLQKYNADFQLFLIKIKDLESFNLPVPISKASSFKKNFKASNLSNLDLILRGDRFILSHIDYMQGGNIYTYDIPNNICTSGDCENGYGAFTSLEGTYKGYWKDGNVHGNGIFVGNEYTYDGEYVNGKQHGQGKKTYTNGTIEEGLFENGEFVGE